MNGLRQVYIAKDRLHMNEYEAKLKELVNELISEVILDKMWL